MTAELHVDGAAYPVDAVIVDKDGTLIGLHALWGTWALLVAERLEAAGGPATPSAARLLRAIGVHDGVVGEESVLAAEPMPEVELALVRVLTAPGRGHEEAARAVETACDLAERDPRLSSAVTALPNVTGFLEDCATHRVRTAVVTADDTQRAREHVEAAGLAHLVDEVVGADLVAASKPDPTGVLMACRRLGASPRRTVMVGDSAHDVTAARRAGLAAGILLRGGDQRGPGDHRVTGWHDLALHECAADPA